MDGSIVFTRWRQIAPHLTHVSLAHPSPCPKRHLDQFSRFSTDHRRQSLYFTIGRPFPLQSCSFTRGSGSFSPPESITQMASRSVFSPFCRLSTVTDQETDHATPSVTIGRICVRSTAMRPRKCENYLVCLAGTSDCDRGNLRLPSRTASCRASSPAARRCTCRRR